LPARAADFEQRERTVLFAVVTSVRDLAQLLLAEAEQAAAAQDGRRQRLTIA
jgi:hypothetical protein